MLGQIRRQISTEIYAISTVLLGLTIVLLTLFVLLTRKKD
jgi:spermidine/putrescine transport system permease protein